MEDRSSMDRVDKLNGTNYHNWKFNVRMLLTGKDLWEIVEGTETVSDEASDAEVKKFRKRENWALSIICLSVSTNLQIYVRNAKTPKDAWKCLADHFEEKSLSKKIMYRRKLYSCRLEKGVTMEHHVNNLTTISEHLEALDDAVQEKDLVMILISSLSEDYNNLITALESVKETELTWTYVRERVIAEYDRKKGSVVKKLSKDVDALYLDKCQRDKGNGSNKFKKNGKKDISHIKCHFCKEKGHFIKDCPIKKNKKIDKEQSNYCEGNVEEEQKDFVDEFALQVSGSNVDASEWYLDSGCSQHMTCVKGDYVTYEKLESPIDVRLADKSVVPAIGQGNVRIVILDNDREVPVLFRNVLFVPRLKKRLLSISEMTKTGAEVKFKGDICSLLINQKTYIIGHKHGKLWKLNNEETCCFGSTDLNDLTLWHQRFGHLNHTDLKKLVSENMVEGMKIDAKALVEPCEGCILGKQARNPFPKKSETKTKDLLELIHSDVCGPMNVASVGGSLYYVSFTDDYSGFTKVFMLKHKSEVFDRFSEYIAYAENFTGKKLKKIRSDNGGEYTSEEFYKYCREKGLVKEQTIPYTPQQNGVSERLNRTIMENVRAMLYHAKLPLYLWAEAVNTLVYLRNRSPTSRFKGETPYERWHGVKPKVDHLRVFGSKCYAHIPDEKRKKLDPKAEKGIFVGYPDGSKGYKIFIPESRRFIRSRDVKFLENSHTNVGRDDERLEVIESLSNSCADYGKSTGEYSCKLRSRIGKCCDENPHEYRRNVDDGKSYDKYNYKESQSGKSTDEYNCNNELNSGEFRRNVDDGKSYDEYNYKDDQSAKEYFCDSNHMSDDDTVSQDDIDELIQQQSYKRPIRNVRPPDRYGVCAAVEALKEPKTFKQAMKCSEQDNWNKAMNEEMIALDNHGTWELVDLPKGKNLVGSKWVYKTKRKANGDVDRYKARLVAQGYSQVAGIDYDEVFAPVARYTSIRSVVAIANQLDLDMHQMDVKCAFLNGELEEEVYMKQPEGFVNQRYPKKVCRLKRSLYGLKQSARCWNQVIDGHLKSRGFLQSQADPCIYYRCRIIDGKQDVMIVAVYVDDAIICANNVKTLSDEKDSLCERFEMDDRGELDYILGMSVKRDRKNRILTIDQNLYLRDILKKFGMEDCRPVGTPVEPGKKFVKLIDEDEAFDDIQLYQAAVGSLNYAAIATRPDLSVAVGMLSKFMSNPSKDHWCGIKRVLRYIRGTLDLGLQFTYSDEFRLCGFSDADWAGCLDTRKSTSGHVFRLGNATIGWRSKKQSIVALSSTESEYVALCAAAQETVWLRNLLKGVGHKQTDATVIYEDNQGAIALAKNPKNHPRTKHIDVKYHYVRGTIEDDIISVRYCATNDMVADFMTKSLSKPLFEKFRDLMGIVPVVAMK